LFPFFFLLKYARIGESIYENVRRSL